MQVSFCTDPRFHFLLNRFLKCYLFWSLYTLSVVSRDRNLESLAARWELTTHHPTADFLRVTPRAALPMDRARAHAEQSIYITFKLRVLYLQYETITLLYYRYVIMGIISITYNITSVTYNITDIIFTLRALHLHNGHRTVPNTCKSCSPVHKLVPATSLFWRCRYIEITITNRIVTQFLNLQTN